MRTRPGDQHRLDPEASGQLRRDAGRDDDPGRQRQVGETSLERLEAEHLLHVERDEEEHREQCADEHEHRQVRREEGARFRKIRNGTSGCFERISITTKARAGPPQREQPDGLRGPPSRALGVHERVDEDRRGRP